MYNTWATSLEDRRTQQPAVCGGLEQGQTCSHLSTGFSFLLSFVFVTQVKLWVRSVSTLQQTRKHLAEFKLRLGRLFKKFRWKFPGATIVWGCCESRFWSDPPRLQLRVCHRHFWAQELTAPSQAPTSLGQIRSESQIYHPKSFGQFVKRI